MLRGQKAPTPISPRDPTRGTKERLRVPCPVPEQRAEPLSFSRAPPCSPSLPQGGPAATRALPGGLAAARRVFR